MCHFGWQIDEQHRSHVTLLTQTNHMCAHIKSRNTSPLCCCYINLSKSNDSICMNHSCSRCVAMISMTIVWLSTIMFNEVLWRFLQIAMPRMNQTIRSITTKFKLYLNELFSFVLNFFCLFGCRLCSIGALHLVQSISACCVWSLNWLRDVFVKSFLARPPFSRHIFFFYKIKKKSYAANILPKCKAFIKCVSILHWRMFIVVIDFHQIGEKMNKLRLRNDENHFEFLQWEDWKIWDEAVKKWKIE